MARQGCQTDACALLERNELLCSFLSSDLGMFFFSSLNSALNCPRDKVGNSAAQQKLLCFYCWCCHAIWVMTLGEEGEEEDEEEEEEEGGEKSNARCG